MWYKISFHKHFSEDGDVYTWGLNSEGQIGFGEDEEECSTPQLLKFDDEVISISCGYYHTAVVTRKIALYFTCVNYPLRCVGMKEFFNYTWRKN